MGKEFKDLTLHDQASYYWSCSRAVRFGAYTPSEIRASVNIIMAKYKWHPIILDRFSQLQQIAAGSSNAESKTISTAGQ